MSSSSTRRTYGASALRTYVYRFADLDGIIHLVESNNPALWRADVETYRATFCDLFILCMNPVPSVTLVTCIGCLAEAPR